MAHHSDWKIDLDRIWNEQKIPGKSTKSSGTCARLRTRISPARQAIPVKLRKKEACWKAFCSAPLNIGDDWRRVLATKQYLPLTSDRAALQHEWDTIRGHFLNDSRSLAEIEAAAGRSWIASRRREPVKDFAILSWDELTSSRGLGMRKIKGLVQLLAAASNQR